MFCVFRQLYEQANDNARDQGATELATHIYECVAGTNSLTKENGQGHRGIIMRSRDMSTCVDHHHQRGADRQGVFGESDCNYQKECADKFCDVLVHIAVGFVKWT